LLLIFIKVKLGYQLKSLTHRFILDLFVWNLLKFLNEANIYTYSDIVERESEGASSEENLKS